MGKPIETMAWAIADSDEKLSTVNGPLMFWDRERAESLARQWTKRDGVSYRAVRVRIIVEDQADAR